MVEDVVNVGVGELVCILLDVAVGVADGDSVEFVVVVGVDVLEHTAYGGGQLGVLVEIIVEVLVAVGIGDVDLLGGGHFSSSALQ